MKGDGPGQLSAPVRISTDSYGQVYIADAGSGFVNKLSPRGEPLLSFQDERLKKPAAIAVDEGGAIYVADEKRNSVMIFLPDGTRYREMSGGPGRRFRSPAGVAVDAEGYIYVAEREAHRIQKFDSRRRFLMSWGRMGSEPGELSYPEDITLGPDGFLYVLDAGGSRVQKFSREGDFVAGAGGPAVSPAQGAPAAGSSGLAVSENYVFLADGTGRRLQIWTLDAQPRANEDLNRWLAYPRGRAAPTDVAVTPAGELLLLDPVAPRLLRFRVNF